jgi:protein-disulfide isomerase
MKVRQLLDDQDSSSVTDANNKIDVQATADRVSGTPTLFIGKTGSKLKPISSTVTFDAAQLAAAIRALG